MSFREGYSLVQRSIPGNGKKFHSECLLINTVLWYEPRIKFYVSWIYFKQCVTRINFHLRSLIFNEWKWDFFPRINFTSTIQHIIQYGCCLGSIKPITKPIYEIPNPKLTHPTLCNTKARRSRHLPSLRTRRLSAEGFRGSFRIHKDPVD